MHIFCIIVHIYTSYRSYLYRRSSCGAPRPELPGAPVAGGGAAEGAPRGLGGQGRAGRGGGAVGAREGGQVLYDDIRYMTYI